MYFDSIGLFFIFHTTYGIFDSYLFLVSNVLHLWEFMRDLLHSANSSGIIEWISQIDGVFRVLNSTEVARLWGEKKKNKKKMTYEKLSRSLR